MNRGCGLHPQAYSDLEEIRDYIAQDSPDAADRMIDEIFDCFERLAQFPGLGTRVRIFPLEGCVSWLSAAI